MPLSYIHTPYFVHHCNTHRHNNRASAASLFTAQPRGDWVSRCSISDVLAAGSIPLVPLDDYGHFMPFTDVLDWRAYTEGMSVAVWGG